MRIADRFRQKCEASPAYARVAPFVIFLVLTFGQGTFGEGSRYWFYLLKTLVGVWLLRVVWPLVSEMRWKISWEAVAVGIAVCVVWVGMPFDWATQDVLWVKLGISKPPDPPARLWNPHAQFGDGSALAWFFVCVRIAGSSLVVPPLEEVFYRSFLYRWLVRIKFLEMPLARFHGLSFGVTALIFGLAHNEWLAGIFCGLAYQGLVVRKGRLGDAMTAHAVTNCLLGLWVVARGAWQFW